MEAENGKAAAMAEHLQGLYQPLCSWLSSPAQNRATLLGIRLSTATLLTPLEQGFHP